MNQVTPAHLEQTTTDDGDSIRQIQCQSAHAEDRLTRRRRRPIETAHEDGDKDDQPDGPDRGLGILVHPSEQAPVGKTSIPAERVKGTGVGLGGGLHGEERDEADKGPDDEGAGLAHPVGHDL